MQGWRFGVALAAASVAAGAAGVAWGASRVRRAAEAAAGIEPPSEPHPGPGLPAQRDRRWT